MQKNYSYLKKEDVIKKKSLSKALSQTARSVCSKEDTVQSIIFQAVLSRQ